MSQNGENNYPGLSGMLAQKYGTMALIGFFNFMSVNANIYYLNLNIQRKRVGLIMHYF